MSEPVRPPLWDRLWRLRRLLWVDHRLEDLESEARLLRAENERLADELDRFRSHAEMDCAQAGELEEWRGGHPLTDNPLVSVCIATYNRARLLSTRSIPSVLQQTYRNLEVVVVGDGCTDDTESAVAALRDERVRFSSLSERGPYPEDAERRWRVGGSFAANAALAAARGEIITELDDDDEYLPERLESIVSLFKATDSDVVWHPFHVQGPDGSWHLNEAVRFARGMVTTGSVAYRAWFSRVLYDPECHWLGEIRDWNRLRRIVYLGPKTARCPAALLRHYRERDWLATWSGGGKG